MARRTTIEASHFVKVWQSASSIDDVVKKLGGKSVAYRARAKALREKGVDLQHFPPMRGRRLNITALKKLAASFKKSKSKKSK